MVLGATYLSVCGYASVESMHVPKHIASGFARRESQDSGNSILQQVREGLLPLVVSSPFVISRLKSPWEFMIVLTGTPRKGRETVKFRDGMKLNTRGTLPDYRAILETCIWDLYSRDFGFDCSEELVVIDIGAHIGTFSVSTAWRFPKSRVYSYEPLKANFDLLRSNTEENRVKSVHPQMVAVAGKRGSATLHVSKDNTGGHSFFFQGDSDVTVDTISLAEVFSTNGLTRCDLLKIDCEGAEYDILLNVPSSVLGLVRNIVLEYHNFGDLSYVDIADHLKSNGFAVTYVGEPRPEKNAIGLLRATNMNWGM